MTKKYKFLHFFHQHFWGTLKEILIYLMWKENKNNGVGQTLNCCPKSDWSWNRLIFFLYVLSYFLIKSFLPLFLSVSFLIFKCLLPIFHEMLRSSFFSVFLTSFFGVFSVSFLVYTKTSFFLRIFFLVFLRVSFLVCFGFFWESFLPIFFRKTSLPLFVLCFVPCFLWVSFITFYKKILSFFWSASFRFFSKISFSWLQLDSNPQPLVHKQTLNHFSKLLAVTSCFEQGVPWHSGT